MEMMLDKKQIWVIFLFEFKMGHKAVETTRYINNGFGPETTNNCTVQCWFKKFCKGDKSLEAEEHGGQSLEIENDQLTAIIEADPCYNDLKFMVRNCNYFCTNLILTTGSMVFKCGPWCRSSSITRELVKNANPWAPPQNFWFRKGRASSMCFNKPSSWFPGGASGKEPAYQYRRGKSLIPDLGRAVASLVVQRLKRLPPMREIWVWSLGWEDPPPPVDGGSCPQGSKRWIQLKQLCMFNLARWFWYKLTFQNQGIRCPHHCCNKSMKPY